MFSSPWTPNSEIIGIHAARSANHDRFKALEPVCQAGGVSVLRLHRPRSSAVD